MLSPEEKETHICTSSADEEWSIYTCQSRMIKKLDKMGLVVYQEDIIEGEVIGKYYKIPLDYLSIRVKKKREMTEEQREELRQRAKQNFGK